MWQYLPGMHTQVIIQYKIAIKQEPHSVAEQTQNTRHVYMMEKLSEMYKNSQKNFD